MKTFLSRHWYSAFRLLLLTVAVPVLLCACTYLKYASMQRDYARIQNTDPSQVNLRHMLDRQTYFVSGETIDPGKRYRDTAMVVAAYSSKYKENELVDKMLFHGAGTHFGLDLPEGDYTLLVYADINSDDHFDNTEIVGERHITLSESIAPDKVMLQADIKLQKAWQFDWAVGIPKPKNLSLKQSLFYPTGTIRSLDDPIFDDQISELGMYDPAAFYDHASTLFYALEEDMPYKMPVIFVHGIGGNVRSFNAIVERLDRERYKPWYFYYASGGDLDQLASFFYKLFLSGKVVKARRTPIIIVAHSMGGLIVREAMNKLEGKARENTVKLLVTLASPMGGHPAAASGEKHGLIVLPAWRDLNPENDFIRNLYRKPLPESVNYQLYYAFKNPNTLKLKENNDGSVPLSSQLHPLAQNQASQQFGFDATHTSILENKDMLDLLISKIAAVPAYYPEQHMKLLIQGGYELGLSDKYDPVTRFAIRYLGVYIVALINGDIEPVDEEQENFVRVVSGVSPAKTELEKGIVLFLKEYGEWIARRVSEPAIGVAN